MKPMKLVLSFLLLVGVLLPRAALAAEAVSVRAILITATNQKREADPKLAAYEAELQRNLPLSSFRYVAEGSTTVAGRPASLSLGRGHQLELEGDKSGGAIKLKVVWRNGSTVVFDTSLTLRAGVPAVLGRRPSDDGETPIVLVIAR